MKIDSNLNVQDIGLEQSGPMGQDSMFSLKPVDKKGAVSKISKGKMAMLSEADARKNQDSGIGTSPDSESEESDDEEDRLERELDQFYNQYKERKAESDAKYRAKRAREEYEDGEWDGVSGDEQESSEGELEEDSSDESDDDDSTPTQRLITDLDNEPTDSGGLSKRAKNFFSQDIFKDIPGILDEPEPEANAVDVEMVDAEEAEAAEKGRKTDVSKESKKKPKQKKGIAAEKESSDPESDDQHSFEVAKRKQGDVDAWEDEDKRLPDGKYGKSTFSPNSHAIPRLTRKNRHRHHHGRGDDASAPARDGGEVEVRRGG